MSDSPFLLEPAPASLLSGPALAEGRAILRSSVQVLRGRDAVGSKVAMLQALGARTGQACALHWLHYFMSLPTEMKKIPTLLLVGLDAGVSAAEATADELLGAALVYEYKIAERGVKIFATDDLEGQRCIVAPEHLRARVAEAACGALAEQGAVAVHMTFEDGAKPGCAATGSRERVKGFAVARRRRSVPLRLCLQRTPEATLSTLGRHTRRNLRYYRRRLESELGAEFVAQVEMGREQFMTINRCSINPAPDALVEWRYDALTRWTGTMFVGVRGRNGRWLSLIGGRRHNQVTEIDWQMNLAGLPRYSLSTAMRSYLLEHEGNLGATSLIFTGGTPHSMRHSFARVEVTDVLAVGQSPSAWMLQKLARWALPQRNFLGQMLRDEHLPWALG